MKSKFSSVLCLILLCLNVSCYGWNKSPDVDDLTWHTLEPYFIAENHPIKHLLDRIFVNRITSNMAKIQAAGFQPLDIWKWDKVSVFRHPFLPGFLVKVFLDDQVACDEVSNYLSRIRGADAIRQAIYIFGYQKYFKVPGKWIYPLPDQQATESGLRRKNFILLVEEMPLVDKNRNENLYYNIGHDQLKALFHMISSLGLSDSVYINNVPFTTDNKIAFIDTERVYLWPIRYEKIGLKLNSSTKRFWDKITEGKM